MNIETMETSERPCTAFMQKMKATRATSKHQTKRQWTTNEQQKMLMLRAYVISIISFAVLWFIPVIYCLAAISGTNACVPFDLARKYHHTFASRRVAANKHSEIQKTAMQTHDKLNAIGWACACMFAIARKSTNSKQRDYVYLLSSAATNELISFNDGLRKTQATSLTFFFFLCHCIW